MPSVDMLSAHRTLSRVPLGAGKALGSRVYRAVAPYFLTIPASLDELEPGRAVASMRPVPWTRNHLGGVHAIAQCNLAEYAMGAAAEATIPSTHRWIPMGMNVKYEGPARGKLTATAVLDLPAALPDKAEFTIPVPVTNKAGETVCSIDIQIWVSKRKPKKD